MLDPLSAAAAEYARSEEQDSDSDSDSPLEALRSKSAARLCRRRMDTTEGSSEDYVFVNGTGDELSFNDMRRLQGKGGSFEFTRRLIPEAAFQPLEEVVEDMPDTFRTRCLHVPANSFTVFWFLVWGILLGYLSATISFWFPNLYLPYEPLGDISITSILQNIIGAGVFGVVRPCSTVKYQYKQTYFIYSAIMGVFCSVFTTFANVVADTGSLLLHGAWYAAPLNLFCNLFFPIIAYETCRRIARKLKKDIGVAEDFVKLENSETRMHLEVEKEIEKEPDEDIEVEKARQMAHWDAATTYLDHHEYSVKQLDSIRAKITRRKEKHNAKWPKWGHYLFAFVLFLIVLANWIVVIVFQFKSKELNDSLPEWFPNATNTFILWDWFIFSTFCIVGALLGSWLSAGRYDLMKSVQWGTFRVNMISCILIGAITNLTLFGSVFRVSEFVAVIPYRFVFGFCGSFSSFGGLIDETVILFHGNKWRHRWNCVRNLFYNLFVCISAYLLVIISVRLAIFVRYWSPASSVFLCGDHNIFSCFIF